MATKLKIVCTPIGNLGDMTDRAREALSGATLILCEDTRKSGPLVARTGSSAKLLSCHQHNQLQRVRVVLESLDRNESVCLISDAGAPGISDPGGALIEKVIEAGFGIEVFPGPSAIVAILMGAGLPAHPFTFLGFLPRKSGARRKAVERVAESGHAMVFFEAPSRIESTLDDLFSVLGPRRVVCGRELTKQFETFHRGRLGDDELSPPLRARGEFVVLVEAGAAHREEAGDPIREAGDLLADLSLRPKARAKELSRRTAMSVADAYDFLEKIRHERQRNETQAASEGDAGVSDE